MAATLPDSLPSLIIWEVLILPLISRFLKKSDLFCMAQAQHWMNVYSLLNSWPQIPRDRALSLLFHISRLHQANTELLHNSQVTFIKRLPKLTGMSFCVMPKSPFYLVILEVLHSTITNNLANHASRICLQLFQLSRKFLHILIIK